MRSDSKHRAGPVTALHRPASKSAGGPAARSASL